MISWAQWVPWRLVGAYRLMGWSLASSGPAHHGIYSALMVTA